jgi:hypothetical protein
MFKKLKEAIKELLSDENGRLSSKRFVGIMCGLFLCVTLLANTFFNKQIVLSTPLIESVAALAFGCLGLSSVDKFTLRNKKNTEENV